MHVQFETNSFNKVKLFFKGKRWISFKYVLILKCGKITLLFYNKMHLIYISMQKVPKLVTDSM